jgi:hypothetical protein
LNVESSAATVSRVDRREAHQIRAERLERGIRRKIERAEATRDDEAKRTARAKLGRRVDVPQKRLEHSRRAGHVVAAGGHGTLDGDLAAMGQADHLWGGQSGKQSCRTLPAYLADNRDRLGRPQARTRSDELRQRYAADHFARLHCDFSASGARRSAAPMSRRKDVLNRRAVHSRPAR